MRAGLEPSTANEGGLVVVVGEALTDLLVAPDGAIRAVPGGGPYNAARTVARLGRRAALVARLSTDPFGAELRRRLEADGVDLRLAETTDDPTTLAVAGIGPDGGATYRFYVDGTSAPGLTGAALADGLPAETRAMHVGTLGLVLEPIGTMVERLVATAADDVVVLLDPNARRSATPDAAAWRARIGRVAPRADIVKASREDLEFLAPDMPPDRAIAGLLAAGTRVVLVTDGARDVEAHVAGAGIRVPVPHVDVVDTVGAGDAFGGAFLASWVARGLGRAELGDADAVRRSVELAVRVAAETCRRAGAEPPFAVEVGWSA
jgi:fructokinase